MCTDKYVQHALEPSNPSSTYDFALTTIHTIEETEKNGTVVTNLSGSTDSTLIKNNKDSNNNTTYESLRILILNYYLLISLVCLTRAN